MSNSPQQPSIRMVDLKTQYERLQAEIDPAIQSVINQTAFINGTFVQDFEAELARYLGVKHAIGCGNGTDALQMALMALDLPKGAEVITADFTFVASAEVILLLGLKPVLVDVDPKTFNLDPKQVEAAITPNTKAIIPVHLFGQAVDMEALQAVAQKHQLFMVEDTAQALGADFHFSNGKTQKLGTIGDIGTTSFFPSKNLGTMGDGGALFTNDDDLAAKIRLIRNHGMDRQYQYQVAGVNSRLDGIHAAILKVKLGHLDDFNHRRQQAAAFYDEGLKDVPGITTPFRSENSTHIFHQYTMVVDEAKRDALKEALDAAGVPNKVYYPDGLHDHPVYAENCRFDDAQLSITNRLKKQVLSLPMHSELSEEQLTYIVEQVKKAMSA